VSTVERARRGGVATGLTQAVMAWLGARGVETVSLLASADGRPVYDRLGFASEGVYREYEATGPPPAAAGDRVRPLTLGDLPALRALDRLATGEDRLPMLEAAFPGGLAVPGMAGAAVAVPWPGTPIVARDPEAGAALLDAVWAAAVAPVRVTVPAANAAAVAALGDRGFRATRELERMRLGPPLAWRPASIWCVANLFWG
jgi:hypothetical protein